MGYGSLPQCYNDGLWNKRLINFTESCKLELTQLIARVPNIVAIIHITTALLHGTTIKNINAL